MAIEAVVITIMTTTTNHMIFQLATNEKHSENETEAKIKFL